jgi:hypothetical protein
MHQQLTGVLLPLGSSMTALPAPSPAPSLMHACLGFLSSTALLTATMALVAAL